MPISLNDLNNVLIESDTVCLCELKESDYSRIVEIVGAYSLEATALLFNQSYLHNRDNFKSEIQRYDNSLNRVLKMFDSIQLTVTNRFEFNCGREALQRGERNNWREHIEHIKQVLNRNVLFSPYGPLQAMTSESVNNFIARAIEARNIAERELFRLGIKIKDTLIGCFVFDFIYNEIEYRNTTYHTIGDIGIFIDPDYRSIKDNNGKIVSRSWLETFKTAASFIKEIFHLYKKYDNTFISATTHPLNMETGGILSNYYGFFNLEETIETEYGQRKRFIINIDKFFEIFKKI